MTTGCNGSGYIPLHHTNSIKASLGNDEPILADCRRVLDRREISTRWLAGTVLVGATSCLLMGYALLAAFQGKQQLAIPAEAIVAGTEVPHPISERGNRVVETKIVSRPVDRAIIKAPVVVREGPVDVVRPGSFALVRMTPASNLVIREPYPELDPLEIFAGEGAKEVTGIRLSTIYAADIVSEVSFRLGSFPMTVANYSEADETSAEEVEAAIRSNGDLLLSLSPNADSRFRVDPLRFSDRSEAGREMQGSLNVKVIEENVTTTVADGDTAVITEFEDEVITSSQNQPISSAILARGYDALAAAGVEKALTASLGDRRLSDGQAIRMGIVRAGETARIVRLSLYQKGQHVLTLAVTDGQRLVAGIEPPMNDAILAALNEQVPAATSSRQQPTVYDGLYRSALSYGMTRPMIIQMMRLVAAHVDLQARTRPADRLEAFFSAADQDGRATTNSQLLYVRARIGDVTRSFYRFQDPATQSVDFYDSDGKAVRPLLIRRPVANARLTSEFGGRRHPTLGYVRNHTGVDLAAPQGTPIMAAGDGVIEKAGWSSSYGNHTVVRHADGYVTSYSHQSAIANGIAEGVRVRQGQIIGFVGSTGRSTGSHLHYELMVNGTRVDAMRTKLPQSADLSGETFEQFMSGRKRIEDLLNSEGEPSSAPAIKSGQSSVRPPSNIREATNTRPR